MDINYVKVTGKILEISEVKQVVHKDGMTPYRQVIMSLQQDKYKNSIAFAVFGTLMNVIEKNDLIAVSLRFEAKKLPNMFVTNVKADTIEHLN
jgi:hypothetical protein